MSAFILLTAIVLDALLGEIRRYHPLVGFGHCAHYLERLLNQPNQPINNFFMGLLSIVLLTAPPIIVIYIVSQYFEHSIYALVLDIIILYWAIGLQSLKQHVTAVQSALETNNITLAREKVGFIVSRNTQQLDKQGVTNAAIETTLENGNDAFFAVLFCYVIGGIELAIVYRLINTLDAMWGYRNQRFEYFGKTAAKLDDLLNYIPARLTAVSYSICGDFNQGINAWFTQASLLKSPNAGPVMTAGAGSLNLQLGGNTYYHQKLVEKPLFGGSKQATSFDITRSIKLVYFSALLWWSILVLENIYHLI